MYYEYLQAQADREMAMSDNRGHEDKMAQLEQQREQLEHQMKSVAVEKADLQKRIKQVIVK